MLEDLARSRGMNGADELARRVAEVDPDYTGRDILEASWGGFGDALEKVINTTELGRERIVQALAGAARRARALGICSVPGCQRPGDGGVMTTCKEHRRASDAQAEEEAWDLALSILQPWVEATRKIGSDELTRVMEAAEAAL